MNKGKLTVGLSFTVVPADIRIRFGKDLKERLVINIDKAQAELGTSEPIEIELTERHFKVTYPITNLDSEAVSRARKTIGSYLGIAVDQGKNADLLNEFTSRYPGLKDTEGFTRVVACFESLELAAKDVMQRELPNVDISAGVTAASEATPVVKKVSVVTAIPPKQES